MPNFDGFFKVPFLDDFVYTCADAYTRDDVIEMERIMLGKLNFDIAGVTVLHFLEEMFEGMPATVPAVHRAKVCLQGRARALLVVICLCSIEPL